MPEVSRPDVPSTSARAGRDGAPPPGRLPAGKRALFGALLGLLALALGELGARLLFFAAEGGNPYYLTFGLVYDVAAGVHSAELDGYSKFEPSVTKHQKIKGGPTLEMRINADGFRGARDFARPKPDRAFRLAALGGSSTFGYYVEDDATWPRQLEELLQRAHPDTAIEVLNLGVPHATSATMLALAEHELPGLEIDLLVVYEAINDASHPKTATEAGWHYRFKDWLLAHSVAWRSVHRAAKTLYYALVRSTNADPLGLPNLSLPIELTTAQVEALRRDIGARYRENLGRLIALGERLGFRVLFATQSTTLYYDRWSELRSDWRSYGDELLAVEQRYRTSGKLVAPEATLLIHGDLMQVLRELAPAAGTPLADGVGALERDRSQLLSYVHLSPEGNRLLAEAIARAIAGGRLIPG